MADTESTTFERSEWLGWIEPWEEGRASYRTGGNRCPRCGESYPDHVGIKDALIYAAMDAVKMRCRCRKCGLEFNEFWMWIEDDKQHEIALGYQDTFLIAEGDEGKDE